MFESQFLIINCRGVQGQNKVFLGVQEWKGWEPLVQAKRESTLSVGRFISLLKQLF